MGTKGNEKCCILYMYKTLVRQKQNAKIQKIIYTVFEKIKTARTATARFPNGVFEKLNNISSKR
jgi:hypothetical protein